MEEEIIANIDRSLGDIFEKASLDISTLRCVSKVNGNPREKGKKNDLSNRSCSGRPAAAVIEDKAK